MTRMSRVSPGGAGSGCLERERQPTLASANTGNNHLLFFYFVSLHISRPHKKREAGKVLLVERAVQECLESRVALSSSTLERPNTACGEEGVEVEHSTLVLLPQSPQSLESREREIRGHKELECGGSRGKCL